MQHEKILLVDDEEITNAIQTRIVKTEFPGLDILNFDNAKELLSVLESINYEPLIFLDLNMPHMDALEFLEELDKLSLRITPLIFILTKSRNQANIKFLKKHPLVKEVIFKPLDDQKIKAVKNILNTFIVKEIM